MCHFDAISFDYDGTLLLDDLAERFVAAAAARGLPVVAARLPLLEQWRADLFGSGRAAAQRQRLGDERFWLAHNREALALLGAEASAGAVAALTAAMQAGPISYRLAPGVPAVLHWLKAAGYRLALLTNRSARVVTDLPMWGLDALFDVVVHRETVGAAKPDPAPFRHALDWLGVPPARLLHVGDNPHADVVGARAAGAAALLLDPHGLWAPGWPGVATIPDLTALDGWLAARG